MSHWQKSYTSDKESIGLGNTFKAFYGKKKKKKVTNFLLTIFYISHESDIKTIIKLFIKK